MAGDGLWRVADVAEYLRIPKSTVYRLASSKTAIRLPHVRIGGLLRFQKRAVDAWLQALTVSDLDMLQSVSDKLRRAEHGVDP